MMVQSEDTVYDYSADFDKICESVVYKEAEEGEDSATWISNSRK